MLISERHRFIFIHIYKNAGSSITNALMPFVQNRYQAVVNAVFRKLDTMDHRFLLPRPYPHHIRARELIEKIGAAEFRKYFSFAVVRNPWDWQVSLYNYMLKTKRHHQHKLAQRLDSFDRYIEWRCNEEVRLQKDFVSSRDGEIVVNFIGRYENLDADFQEICSRIGVVASLAKLNVSYSAPYREFYDAKTRDMVREAFAEDIQLFGYEF